MMTKIISWNVNGIRAVVKKGNLQELMEKYDPDILCLQETKAEQGQAEIDFLKYKEYWNSAQKKGYSGTAIFSKIEPISVEYDMNCNLNLADKYGDPIKEGRVIAAEFEKFFVVCVYTPNAKDDLSRIPLREKWDKEFCKYCKKLEEKKPVIFCGDLNVAHTEMDLARPKENTGKKGFTPEERNGFENFIKAEFIDTLRLFKQGNGYYTWWTHWGGARARNVGWRIDYVLVSKMLKEKISSAEIYAEIMGSDHCPVGIEIAL